MARLQVEDRAPFDRPLEQPRLSLAQPVLRPRVAHVEAGEGARLASARTWLHDRLCKGTCALLADAIVRQREARQRV